MLTTWLCPPIMVKEGAALQILRLLNIQDDKFFYEILNNLATRKQLNNRWLQTTSPIQWHQSQGISTTEVPPRAIPTFTRVPLTMRKRVNTPDIELRSEFLDRMDALPCNSTVTYTGSSVGMEGRAGCGVIVVDISASLGISDNLHHPNRARCYYCGC